MNKKLIDKNKKIGKNKQLLWIEMVLYDPLSAEILGSSGATIHYSIFYECFQQVCLYILYEKNKLP